VCILNKLIHRTVADVPGLLKYTYSSILQEATKNLSESQRAELNNDMKCEVGNYLDSIREKLDVFPSPCWIQNQSMGAFMSQFPEMLSGEDQLQARQVALTEILQNLR